MNDSLTYLNEWRSGHDCLLIMRLADDRFDLRGYGFIKELTRDEIILDLVDTGEFRLPILGNMTFTYLDASNATDDINEQIKCSVVIKWPGFKFSLSLLRKQPVINYPAD